jgi:hypothetical protein
MCPKLQICNAISPLIIEGAVVVMIVWQLDLQLPMQSVPITSNVVSSNQTQERYTQYNIM